MSKQKRSTRTDIKYANVAITETTAKRAHVTKGEVKDVIKFVGNFIRTKIEQGNMETIMIPYFGKIKPKEKLVRTSQFFKRNKVERP